MEQLRICHVITNTEVGGAETMLLKLLRCCVDCHINSTVISLMSCGEIGRRIQELGIPVITIDMRRRFTALRRMKALKCHLRNARPDVVQTWMYHADLLGGLMARRQGFPVVWGVRHGPLDPLSDSRGTRIVAHTCAKLSKIVPASVVFNSNMAACAHQQLGYDKRKSAVIPNGFDTQHFFASTEYRQSFRHRVGAADDEILIGHCGRFHAVKDHASFVRAAELVTRKDSRVRLVMAGKDVTPDNLQLASMLGTARLVDKCHLLGHLDDTRLMMNGIDHLAVSSTTEGFPNVVGEAMSCGTSCIVTDVGECRRIVGGTGWVVAARQPTALATAILSACRMSARERQQKSIAARQRIEQAYRLPRIADQFIDTWCRAAGRERDDYCLKPSRSNLSRIAC